jgi:hypothetical protein
MPSKPIRTHYFRIETRPGDKEGLSCKLFWYEANHKTVSRKINCLCNELYDRCSRFQEQNLKTISPEIFAIDIFIEEYKDGPMKTSVDYSALRGYALSFAEEIIGTVEKYTKETEDGRSKVGV